MRKIIPVLILLLAGPALGQSITFSADVTQANGAATPVLSWDTDPLADNCEASGDWSGPKGGAGNETLATITASATYNLTCTWSEDTATLTWEAPTENTDGSAYTDPDGYWIRWGASSGEYSAGDRIQDPDETQQIVTGLAAGDWYFVASTVNQAGVESAYSNEVMKTMGTDEQTETVAITINPVPRAPSGLSIQ